MAYFHGLKCILFIRIDDGGFANEGGEIGNTSICPHQLLNRAPYNLVVGEHVSIQTSDIDTRAKVIIGNHVIIGQDVKIITESHNIDSLEWELKSYGLVIDDYVWIATSAVILPSCRKIGYGAVIGACSVVAFDVPNMAIVSGNPAKIIRYRKCVHENLCVESLLAGDFKAYVSARKA